MASREINLVPKVQADTPQELKVKRLLKHDVPLVLGVVVLILVALGGYSYIYLGGQIGGLERNIATERSQIEAIKKNEGIYLLLKQKATALSTIFSQRYPYADVFNYFQGLKNENVVIRSMKMATGGVTILEVRVTNTQVLDEFIQHVLAGASEKFKKVQMESVGITQEGNFNITLHIDHK